MASIVQQWGDNNPSTFSTNNSSPTTAAPTLDQLIAQTALNNGVEKPRGHTVSFHYNSEVEQHHFGRSHPMKPWRLQLTKQLILSYGLQYAMDMHITRPARKDDMAKFHKDDYLDFLSEVTPENMSNDSDSMRLFNFGDDCPVFDGLFNYCSLYTGASLSAARCLTSSLTPSSLASPKSDSSTQTSDIAINWSGGLHHAHKSHASGFCYINDIVLTIQHLLRYVPRILYIDIDVHHGDGVEEAFHSSDRVLTLSFHKYDKLEFFPGTGALDETGPRDNRNLGCHHSLNCPLKDGIDDEQYIWLFQQTAGKAVETFRPSAIVFQCGADSLGGDRLGKFNLNIAAHGACLDFIRAMGIPLLVLGGGGYTARNVARLWCHETSLCTRTSLSNDLPAHVPYMQAFAGAENGDSKLYPELGGQHRNDHDEGYLLNVVRRIHEQLRYLKGAPSVEMKRMPRDVWGLREEMEREAREEREDERGDMESAIVDEEERGGGGGGGGGGNGGGDGGGSSGDGETGQRRSEKRRRDKERGVGGRGEFG
ncbi:MAG: histone deacetylase [Chrysothrix sp. TS-e1954]|nr:MAG: histone deacetylase [Chrysothrix sp. TS-e1954]